MLYTFDVRFIIQSKLLLSVFFALGFIFQDCEEKDPGNEFGDRVTCASL